MGTVAPHPDSVLAGGEREVALTARRASSGRRPAELLAALSRACAPRWRGSRSTCIA